MDAPASVGTESTFTAQVEISNVTNFDNGDFRVSFDPTVLAIDDISPGTSVTDGDIGGTTIPVVGTSQVSSGTIKVVVNVPGTSVLSAPPATQAQSI